MLVHQPASDNKDDIIAALVQRVDAGGMVLVDSDVYPVNPLNTELADIVLPAAAWGEHDGARCNGERRLQLYTKFYDAPGEAKPDWWAVAKLARRSAGRAGPVEWTRKENRMSRLLFGFVALAVVTLVGLTECLCPSRNRSASASSAGCSSCAAHAAAPIPGPLGR